MYDYQLIALLLVLWTQPGDKTRWLAMDFRGRFLSKSISDVCS
jgi:hypothetical protein